LQHNPPERIEYRTDHKKDARSSFEDKFGGPKAYNFQLKEELPMTAYDYIWARVYPSRLRRDEHWRSQVIFPKCAPVENSMTVPQNRLWLHAAAIEAHSHTGYFTGSAIPASYSEPLILGDRIVSSWWSDESHDARFSITKWWKIPI
jgi:hypothetical protein